MANPTWMSTQSPDAGHVVLQQLEIHFPPDAAHVDHSEPAGVGHQLHDPAGNGQTHG